MDETQTYVVGHTRPDSDSICSAIAYAAFKRAEGVEATPLIQGPPNAETEFLLEYFDVETPAERRLVPEGEVILVDPEHPAIQNDDELNWICDDSQNGRAFRGLTNAGKRNRGLSQRGKGTEKTRPSVSRGDRGGK